MTAASSRTASLSDLLSFNLPSKPASASNSNNNNNGTKHKLYNPVVTPDFL